MNPYATARDTIADLKAKKISARELLNAHVARNDVVAKKINAVVATDLERATKAAAAIDDARARGETLGPLAGLPMTIKDGLDVENMPATSGAPQLANRDKNCADAAMVKLARDAGAVIWGKTNVPFMLGDLQSYNAIYGTTNNPYDLSRTPGGSSGGAAAALACGVTPLEIGSDIGGSLRHPANFCGVMALKPTWGVLDLRGHIPPTPDRFVETDLGVVGPMARNGEDLKLLWSVLSSSAPKPRRNIRGALVAVWDEEASWPLASEVRAHVTKAADALSRAGANVVRAKPEIDGERLMDSYMALLTAILGLGLPEEMIAAWEASRVEDRKLAAQGRGDAAYRLRATATYRDVLIEMTKRQAMKDKLAGFFARYDAILMPITTIVAFKHQQEPGFQERVIDVDGKSVPYGAMLDWISPATALHAPAIAVQAGRTPYGVPVGVQVVGPWHGEDRLFDFAAAIEDGLGGFAPPPID
jgi:amidase